MYFDRFDIAAAYYHFAHLTLHRGMHYDYQTVSRYQLQKMMQLESMRYRPGLSDSKLSSLSSNAKAIYQQLVVKHLGIARTHGKS